MSQCIRGHQGTETDRVIPRLLVVALMLAGLSCGGEDVTPPPSTGTLEITTSTSGTEQDPDGYSLRMDGGAIQAIGAAATLTTNDVTPGSHTLQLGEVAANCSVSGDNPRTVSVTAGEKAAVAFSVACGATTPTTGIIRVSITTSGSPADPDGYVVKLDGADPGLSSGTSGSVSFTSVAVGSHTVALTGLAANCGVADGASRTVTVTAGAEAPVGFAVTCTSSEAIHWSAIPLPPGFIASAIWASSPSDIFVVGLDQGAPSAAPRLVLHYDGHAWAEKLRGRDWWESPRALWGRSATDVFAAGGTQVSHYDGSHWLPIWDGYFTANYQSIWGASAQHLFAGGWDDGRTPSTGAIDHYDGTTWSRTAGHGFGGTNGSIYDIAGTSPSDVYALGSVTSANDTPPELFVTYYRVEHYDGSTWTLSFESIVPAGPGDFFSLSGVWAVAQNNVVVVGSGGHILRFDGAGWSPMASPTTQDLHDVWGDSGSNVYAVGDGGILHYDGARWTVVNAAKGTRVWGAGADVFVISNEAILHGAP